METEVILRYRRVGLCSAGKILLRTESTETELTSFNAAEWVPMMSSFARALIEYPEAKGTIERDDRAGLAPMPLSEEDLQKFRSNPAGMIRSMIYVAGGVVQPRGITTGYDVLAEIFGDDIYLRRRGRSLECPCCAGWEDFVPGGDAVGWTCPTCNAYLVLMIRSERWVSIKTEDLLNLVDKFYLPRGWNPARWISNETLNEKYGAYKKEKEGVT